MKTRIITGTLLALFFVAIVIVGKIIPIMPLILSLVGGIGAWEIIHAVNNKVGFECPKVMEWFIYLLCVLAPLCVYGTTIQLLVLFVTISYFLFFIMQKENYLPFFSYSLMMVALLGFSLYSITHFYQINTYFIIFFALLSVGTDVFAYFGGFLFGKHKLIPWVSPKKTIEGAVAGVLGAIGLSFLGQWAYEQVATVPLPDMLNIYKNPLLWIGLIVIFSIVSQYGDLFYSKIKRFFGRKDYGVIFPGHGGVLDRLDGVVFVTVTFLLLTTLIF